MNLYFTRNLIAAYLLWMSLFLASKLFSAMKEPVVLVVFTFDFITMPNEVYKGVFIIFWDIRKLIGIFRYTLQTSIRFKIIKY